MLRSIEYVGTTDNKVISESLVNLHKEILLPDKMNKE